MKSNPKQTTRLVCSMCLALLLLATVGCGSKQPPAEKTSAVPAVTTEAEKPAEIEQPQAETKPVPTPVIVGPSGAPVSNPPAVATPAELKPTDATGAAIPTAAANPAAKTPVHAEQAKQLDYSSLLFVFMLATFIGLGVIMRVSRLLHTPLMSITNAISAIAVVGSIIVVGEEGNPWGIQLLGAVALFASMTNIISGFLITDRMLKMFKSPGNGGKR